MKIELEVSEEHEGTSAPWWMIIDPSQMMRSDPATVAMGMVTGPFFSRKEAEDFLKATRYNFGKNPVVWCASGCYSKQYSDAYAKAENKIKEALKK